ncbi:MAG TPA: hypothetical protein VK709_17285 [Candidatus Saccharimonadales bacterium]|jgi:hypothetical protein|nr:hypothetical protein [Candidatus Saccharimonadales bacterium]
MNLEDESPVYTGNKCTTLIDDKSKPVPEQQSKQYVSGSGSKKVYHSPILTVYGTLEDLVRLKVNSREI